MEAWANRAGFGHDIHSAGRNFIDEITGPERERGATVLMDHNSQVRFHTGSASAGSRADVGNGVYRWRPW